MVVFVHFNHFIDRKINFHTNPCNLAFRRLFSVILPPPPPSLRFPLHGKVLPTDSERRKNEQ